VGVFLVRVVLSDRPGALGAVASRIGSVRGDVIGVEIIERRSGRAVDEFQVELAEETTVDLLVTEIEQVDGATVQQIRPLRRRRLDPRRQAYGAALLLLAERSPDGLLDRLAAVASAELEAGWAAVVETATHDDNAILATHGSPPALRSLAALAADMAEGGGTPVTGDVAAATLHNWDLLLVVGRPGWAFTATEQDRLQALASLADARWVELAPSAHPSRVC